MGGRESYYVGLKSRKVSSDKVSKSGGGREPDKEEMKAPFKRQFYASLEPCLPHLGTSVGFLTTTTTCPHDLTSAQPTTSTVKVHRVYTSRLFWLLVSQNKDLSPFTGFQKKPNHIKNSRAV